MPERIQNMKRTIRSLEHRGNTLLAAMTYTSLGEMYHWQGELTQARQAYQHVLELATRRNRKRLPIAGQALNGLGQLAYDLDDLEAADAFLEEGLHLVSRWADIATLDGLIFLSQVRLAQGDSQQAWLLMDAALEMAEASDVSELDDLMVKMARARLALWEGKLGPAKAWARERGFTDSWERPAELMIESRLRKYERLVHARLLLAEDRPQAALAELDGLVALLNARGRLRGVIEAKALEALAYQAMRQQDMALETLREALGLAAPCGFIRLFLDEGQPMAKLLYQALQADIHPEYVGRILAHAPSPKVEGRQVSAGALVEPLTPREREVLELIAHGQTNQEIAHELVVSVGTVKVHARNIYAKLEVSSRAEAAARARELGIL
jgi:LuxR family maltose regulon positive regulatory protein